MICSADNCNAEIANRSKSGLCKKHYGYLWKKLNKDKEAAHCKTTYTRYKAEYIKRSAASRSLARKTKPEVRLRDSLRRRLNNAIKNNQKVGSAVSELDCSIPELKKYLESKFQPGMTWDNYGEWHIDHIKPLKSFNLSILEQLKEACHFTNLQPLWAKDNLKKGGFYEL